MARAAGRRVWTPAGAPSPPTVGDRPFRGACGSGRIWTPPAARGTPCRRDPAGRRGRSTPPPGGTPAYRTDTGPCRSVRPGRPDPAIWPGQSRVWPAPPRPCCAASGPCCSDGSGCPGLPVWRCPSGTSPPGSSPAQTAPLPWRLCGRRAPRRVPIVAWRAAVVSGCVCRRRAGRVCAPPGRPGQHVSIPPGICLVRLGGCGDVQLRPGVRGTRMPGGRGTAPAGVVRRAYNRRLVLGGVWEGRRLHPSGHSLNGTDHQRFRTGFWY